MLSTIADSIKTTVGEDMHLGLLCMFLVLHFYYGVPNHGWQVTTVGGAAAFAMSFTLVLLAVWLGNGFRAAAALTMTAIVA